MKRTSLGTTSTLRINMDDFKRLTGRCAGRPQDTRPATETRCYDLLDSLGIAYFRVDHDPAMTIPMCHEVEKTLGAPICKNLFLCNRQKTQYYLLLLTGDKIFKTKFLSQQLGCARASFAPEEDMRAMLDVTPGSATVLALQNDRGHRVRLCRWPCRSRQSTLCPQMLRSICRLSSPSFRQHKVPAGCIGCAPWYFIII